MKTVRVKIGGQEYNLRSDDEEKVRRIAGMVDAQMHEVRAKLHDQSTTTLSVMTALNIAEKQYESERQIETDNNFIISETKKMTEFLRQCCE